MFIWPPQVLQTNTDAAVYGYFYADDNQYPQHPYHTAGTYLLSVEDYFGTWSYSRYSYAEAADGDLGTGTSWGSSTDVEFTYYVKDYDFTTYGYGVAFRAAQYIIRGDNISGEKALTTDVGYNRVKIFKASADRLVIVYPKAVQTGTSMGQPVYTTRFRYVYYTISTDTFGTPGDLISSPDASSVGNDFDLVDAGEGYAYLVYYFGGFMTVRGVDFTTATPTVTAKLGGSGAAGWTTGTVIPNQCQRYITVGANRVIVVQWGSVCVKLTYTSGTKTAPTVTKTTRACTGTRIALEYDHLTEEAYLVAWTFTGSYPVVMAAAYASVTDISAAFSSFTTVASLYSLYDTPNSLRQYAPMSARLGDTVNSVCVAAVSTTFGDVRCVALAYSVWHTPVEFNLGVDATSQYSDVSASVNVVKERGVDATSQYEDVTVGVVLPAAGSTTFQWLLGDSNIIETGVDAGTTHSNVSVGATEIQLIETSMDQYWLNVGTTYMEDFMSYVNADRAALGLPPYKIFGSDGEFIERIDIANLHSLNMAWYREFAHESPLFPSGQQTMLQRGDLMPAGGVAENIQFAVKYRYSDRQDFGYQSAYTTYLNWHNSPPHYANITRNWGADNSKAYSVLGMHEGLYPTDYPAYSDYVCLYLCNNFVILETVMYEVSVTQYWDNDGALIAKLEQQWANTSYVNVTAQHDAVYGLRVAAAHEAGYGALAAGQHIAPITYTVAAQHTAPYDPTGGGVQGQHEATYDVKATDQVRHAHEATYGLVVAAAHEAVWALNTSAAGQHDASYGDFTRAAGQHESIYDALGYNPVRASHTAYYDLEDWAGISPADTSVVLYLQNGYAIKLDDVVIDNNESDVGYSMECSVADVESFMQIAEDEPVTVYFCGETYSLVIASKSIERSSPVDVGLRVTANSKAHRLEAPYVGETAYVQTTARNASELVDDLIEIDFNYEIVDWPIPAGRLQTSSATPLAAIRQVAEAAGGVIDSTPDGTLRVRLPYPYAMDALADAPVSHVYTDTHDNLSSSSATVFRSGANSFRIREGDTSYGDSIEWTEDETPQHPSYITGVLKAYLSPYRTGVAIKHLGGAVYIEHDGEFTEQHEQMVTFDSGSGSVQYPIDTLVGVEWVTADMGTPAFDPFSTTLNVGLNVNSGYGLAKVTYTARYLKARAGGVPKNIPSGEVGPASAYALFVLEDSNG